jgi:hypothetical protein
MRRGDEQRKGRSIVLEFEQAAEVERDQMYRELLRALDEHEVRTVAELPAAELDELKKRASNIRVLEGAALSARKLLKDADLRRKARAAGKELQAGHEVNPGQFSELPPEVRVPSTREEIVEALARRSKVN